MRTSKVVELLRAQGRQVSVYKRPDGGLRITKIDGIKFTLSEGNNFARQLVGEDLGRTMYEQRRRASIPALEGKRRQKAKRPSLTIRKKDTSEIKRQKQQVKRALRKARKSMKTKKISAEQVVKKIKREGYSKTAKGLLNTARHEAGLAYAGQVVALRDFVAVVYEMANLDSSKETSLLDSNREWFADAYISFAYNALYEIQKGIKEGRDYSILYTMSLEVLDAINEGIAEGKTIYNSL